MKTYCYRSDCKATTTGFRIEEWQVCKTCKEELTPALYEKIKEREKPKANKDLEPEREDFLQFL